MNKTNIIVAIVACALTIAGIILIIQSNSIYNDSLHYVETVTKADTALKGKLLTLPNYTTVKDGYAESLLYFLLAFGVILFAILLPRLQTFSISPTGGVSVTLKDLQLQVNQLKEQNNELQAKTTDTGGGKTVNEELLREVKAQTKANNKAIAIIPDDPQKNRWGGKSEANERRLSAIVKKSALPSLYEVSIKVTGTPNKPLTGLVTFHLHDTFKNQDPIIAVINGEANLLLKRVWGAFTVGAEADNGVTRLELDLSELKDAPKDFKER